MRRRRWGVGAELAPLVLILACLAGSFGLIVAAYRRVNGARQSPAEPPVVAIAPPSVPLAAPPVAPISRPVAVAVAPLAPPPVDPTPAALAQLTAAEAEQLLAASQANRQAQALDEARQVAVIESERWRRRQSLIHAQVDTLETKVRKVETDLDALALERDALQKELDAKKAAVARAKSRPSQAILPHKGPNGTWRRPIVVECRNGAAVIQPQGLEFGLLDLETGYGAMTNPFVAAIAREAMRVQRQDSPDGAPVVPYIFFLVRPDGIRSYYEARGRLEPLGVTFGYELADSEWDIEFPDLDDVSTWDGSPSARGVNPVLTGTIPGTGAAAEDIDLPTWPTPGRTGPGAGGAPSSPFTFGGGGAGGGGAGGGASRNSIMGRAFDGGAPPTAGSRFAGRNGPGGGGSNRNASAAALGSAGGTAASEPTGPAGGDSGSTAAPAGYPASFLAGGDGTKQDGSAQPAGDSVRPGGTGASPPANSAGMRVTAAGRLVSGGAGRTAGRPSGDPAGEPGAAGAPWALARGGAGGPPGTAGDPGRTLAGARPNSPRGGKPAPPSAAAPPFELALDGPTADSVGNLAATDPGQSSGRGGLPGGSASPARPASSMVGDLARHDPPPADPAGSMPPLEPGATATTDEPDPASTFVWSGGPNGEGKRRPPGETSPAEPSSLPGGDADREIQAAEGADPSLLPGSTTDGGPTTGTGGAARPGGGPGGAGGTQAARRMLGPTASPGGQGQPASTDASPPPGAIGLGLPAPAMPAPSSPPNLPPPSLIPPVPPLNLPIPTHPPSASEAAAAVRRQTSAPPNLADWTPPGSIVDRTFEVVVVCGPQGVIVHPGNYRVTVDALKDREGLFKKQVVALVKNRRLVDPKTQVEPRIRFLIQPSGFDTYRLARSQFFVSGLNWPTSTQVADPDPLVIQSRGVW